MIQTTFGNLSQLFD